MTVASALGLLQAVNQAQVAHDREAVAVARAALAVYDASVGYVPPVTGGVLQEGQRNYTGGYKSKWWLRWAAGAP